MSNPAPMVSKTSPEYRSIPVSNVLTALVSTEGKLLAFFDRLEPTVESTGEMKIGKVIRELEVELHFSPETYKACAEAMMRAVHNFEEQHKTTIKPPEEKDERRYT